VALRRARGQATPFAILVAGLCLVGSLLVIDIGLLFNDRHAAQNDVDLAALAGALEIALNDPAHAEDRELEWLTSNGVDLADPDIDISVEPVSDCFSANDGHGTFYPRCDFPGGAGFVVHFRFVEQVGATGGTLGVTGYGGGETFLAR
jgi:uncharacterized membrane protein